MKSEVSVWRRLLRRPPPLKFSVSSPHPVSNLRLLKFRDGSGADSPAQLHLRKMHMDLQDWNQKYWESHNRLFNEQKELFLSNSRKNLTNVSHDELAVFYKKFLDENRSKHMQYSIEWYRRLFRLLSAACRAIVDTRR